MMNYQSTPRSNRPRASAAKYVLQFALFAAFSLWLLYQIRQPNGGNESSGSFFGRKRSDGLSKSKSTPIAHSGLTLEDVTNPGEENQIPRYSKGIEEGNSTLLQGQTRVNEDGALTLSKSNISFPDENGIPQHVRDKFVGTESGRVKIQNVRGGNKSDNRIRES